MESETIKCTCNVGVLAINTNFPLLSVSLQSLLLLHYLINNGSERVVTNAREHIYDMKALEDYAFRDENGKDQGINGQ